MFSNTCQIIELGWVLIPIAITFLTILSVSGFLLRTGISIGMRRCDQDEYL